MDASRSSAPTSNHEERLYGSPSETVRPRDESSNVFVDMLEVKMRAQVVSSEQEAYIQYCEYAHAKGFSVRKGKQYYFTGSSIVKSKEYYCSKEGNKNEKLELRDAAYSRPVGRTGCKAMIRFAHEGDQVWRVTKFVSEHNHDLAKPEEAYLLKSSRAITVAKAGAIESMVNSGIPTVNAYNYIAEESGGIQNMGYTLKDCYNFVDMLKASKIEAGDAQSLVHHFKKKANEEGLFYWDVQLDEYGRVSNFFWRDSRSRIDYDYFGDVVEFDTTYRTNRYNLVCAPFIGVNHHWQNVIFACAFLSDETAESFKWLFRTFLESMGNQAPKTIFTDQDQAIANAIAEVFPNSSHRLCLWHISKNAPSRLGSVYGDNYFKHLFHQCLSGCHTEMEFDETWSKMIFGFNLDGNIWLRYMYNIRQKWCTALNGRVFNGGIKATSRVESTNNVLHGMSKASTSLTEFIIAFEKLVERWRRHESEADFHSNQGFPTLPIKHSGILKDAAKHYTLKIYKLFEKEYLDGLGGSSSTEVLCGENLYRFDVVMHERGSRVSIVYLDISTMEVQCTCQKFETMGILCSHSLRAFNLKNVQRIPDKYILHRWTKGVRDRVMSMEGEPCNSNNVDSMTVYRNHAMRSAYNMITQGQHNKETRATVWKILNEGSSKLNKLLHKLNSDGHRSNKRNQPDEERDDSDEECQILDPARVRPKGVSNARLKGHFEKRKKKTTNSKKKKDQKTMETSTNASEKVIPADGGVHVPKTAPFTSNPILSNHEKIGIRNNHITFLPRSINPPTLGNVHRGLPNSTQESSIRGYYQGSSSRKNSAMEYRSQFPDGIKDFITNVINPISDGHCGYRVIAELLGIPGTDGWKEVRKNLWLELITSGEFYEQISLFQIEEIKTTLDFYGTPASKEHWMTMPDMGHIIATRYNVVVFFFSSKQCLTFLPLRSSPLPPGSRKEIAIGLVNEDHFVQLHLASDHPVPPIANYWFRFHEPKADGWQHAYNERISYFEFLVRREDVSTNETIQLD